MKRHAAVWLAGLVLLGLAGCKTINENWYMSGKSVPEDRQLVYDRALDYTYQVVLDAIIETPGWELYTTDKTTGKIMAIDNRAEELLNPDNRTVTLWVKPMGRRKSAVTLDKSSLHTFRATELMDAIEIRMGRVQNLLAPVPK